MDPRELREQTVRDAKCALILDSALQLFSEKGYWETRLEDIAARAGFSKASLYNYYTDKEAIFLSLVVREYQAVLSSVAKEISEAASFEQNLRRALVLVFAHFSQHVSLVANTSDFHAMVALHEKMHRNEQLASQFKEYMERTMALFTQIVSWGRSRGDVHSHLDDSTLSWYIGALVRGVLVECRFVGVNAPVEETVAKVCEFIEFGATGNVSPVSAVESVSPGLSGCSI